MIDFEMELTGRPFREAAEAVRSIVGRPELKPTRRIVCTYRYRRPAGGGDPREATERAQRGDDIAIVAPACASAVHRSIA